MIHPLHKDKIRILFRNMNDEISKQRIRPSEPGSSIAIIIIQPEGLMHIAIGRGL